MKLSFLLHMAIIAFYHHEPQPVNAGGSKPHDQRLCSPESKGGGRFLEFSLSFEINGWKQQLHFQESQLSPTAQGSPVRER